MWLPSVLFLPVEKPLTATFRTAQYPRMAEAAVSELGVVSESDSVLYHILRQQAVGTTDEEIFMGEKLTL